MYLTVSQYLWKNVTRNNDYKNDVFSVCVKIMYLIFNESINYSKDVLSLLIPVDMCMFKQSLRI